MNCAIAEQITEHANADSQAEALAEYNQIALNTMFNDDEGLFSNGYINISDVVEEAGKQDPQFMIEQNAEFAKLSVNCTKGMIAVHKLLRNRLSIVALEINENMAESH